MPDRNLREPNRAYEERLRRIEGKIESLGRRAWRGAMQTAGPISTAGNSAFTFTDILALEVPSGRWEVHVSGRATGPTTGSEEWGLTTACREVGTLAPIASVGGALPGAALSTDVATATTAPMRRSLAAFGWVQLPDRFVLTLSTFARAYGTGVAHATPPRWDDLRIMMLPW